MFRVGLGWDIHRLVPLRPFLLGGVTIPADRGEWGHSDGDVLAHAVIDALLGAAALGDIGEFAWEGGTITEYGNPVANMGIAPLKYGGI